MRQRVSRRGGVQSGSEEVFLLRRHGQAVSTSKEVPWAAFCIVLLVLATGAFVLSDDPPAGSRAGSPLGITLGAMALGLFVFEALLALRRSRPAWHFGRAATWLRAHVWLGLLAFALSWLHSGFRARGTASLVLVSLLTWVTLSGLLGVWIRRVLPRLMTQRVPREVIHAQIPRVLEGLATEAGTIVEARNDAELTLLYQEEVRGFLQRDVHGHPLLDPNKAARLFGHARKRVSPDNLEALADIQDICRDREQLFTQQRIERFLFGWRIIHVPLSFALLVLTIAHAVVTLAY